MKCLMKSWPASAAKRRAPVATHANVPGRQPGAVRILGIDPGLRHTGWGIIESIGNRLIHVSDGVIEPEIDLTLAERLHHLLHHNRPSIGVVRLKPDTGRGAALTWR